MTVQRFDYGYAKIVYHVECLIDLVAMHVKQAKFIARQWVHQNAASIPGYFGAFFHGSINWLADADSLPPTSDVDVMIVLTASEPPDKPGKIRYQDVLLEISYLSREQLRSPEQVLKNFPLAPSFSVPGVIADPTGELTQLQAAVSRDYAQYYWVSQRCAAVRQKALNYLDGVHSDQPFHDQVIRWLFGTSLLAPLLLVAGLQNPTVRKRYVLVRELLAAYGYLDIHETLLELLGCQRLSRVQVEQHLAALATVFDATQTVIRSPFPFASDMSAGSRTLAIDGSQALIDQGMHREAVFWIAVTYARCMIVLAQYAPNMLTRYDAGFRHLLSDLGITTFADIQRCTELVKNRLPAVWAVAETIMHANPAIKK